MALSARLLLGAFPNFNSRKSQSKPMRSRIMTKHKCAFLTMLAGVLFSLPLAQAQTWSTVASACEPGSDSLGLYVYSNGSFEFVSGETGKIATRCLVNNPMDKGVPSWKTLTVGFQDPDGRDGVYEVQGSLERVAKSTGVH